MTTPAFLDAFHRLGAKPGERGMPPSRKLGLLIRPAFIARPGRTFVWCDWSAIEARVLPWLANSRSAEAVLDIFRENDKDKSRPDIYKITAGALLNKHPSEVTDDERQAYGKVPVLSLGFGGGLGALVAMATNYRVYLDETTGLKVIEGWRETNPWARGFWGKHDRGESFGLWGAINRALEDPNTIHTAGRVAYVYDPQYMGGTVFCALPGGRLLTYPTIRWEKREVEWPKGSKQLVERTVLSFRKDYGRSFLWYGKLAENVTQALAASILRGTLVKLEYDEINPGHDDEKFVDLMPVVGHTHDEVLTEPREEEADDAAQLLHDVMVEGFDWSEGLPLAAEATTNWYYTKAKEEKRK